MAHPIGSPFKLNWEHWRHLSCFNENWWLMTVFLFRLDILIARAAPPVSVSRFLILHATFWESHSSVYCDAKLFGRGDSLSEGPFVRSHRRWRFNPWALIWKRVFLFTPHASCLYDPVITEERWAIRNLRHPHECSNTCTSTLSLFISLLPL